MLNKNQMLRLHLMMLFCLLIFFVLIGRMVYLQLWRSDYYAKQSDGNRLRQSRIVAPRGLILDNKGKQLVNNVPGYMVALQKQNKYKEENLVELSKLLDIPLEKIKEKIKEKANYYEPVVLKTNLTPELMVKVEEQRRFIPELMLIVNPERNYPFMDFAVHTLGYVGEVSDYELEKGIFKDIPIGSIVGKSGLEKTYDKVLRGEDGFFMEEVDVAGNVIQHYESKKPVVGKNLRLTIDFELQKALEDFIDGHLNSIGAHAAAVVAMDPRDGAIRAMISRPGYNPNLFVHGISSRDWNKINNNPFFPMNNKAISGEYPPGSTFKVVTGSAALDMGKVDFNELILDKGYHDLVPTMSNAGGEVLGWLNFKNALAMSDNVYFYELGYRVGIDNIGKYARYYGFGSKTGIDLEGEGRGLVASKKVKKDLWNEDWRLGDTFNAAIGQGFNLATPLQLAVMLSCVANGGLRNTPYLVEDILNPDGTVFDRPKREAGKKLEISDQTMEYIRIGMGATTEEGGTAAYFTTLPRKIAGKTGTAENSMGRDHGLFVAYGPVEQPELVVVCIVEQGGFGSTAAGPIVYKAFEEFFMEKGWMPRPELEKQEKVQPVYTSVVTPVQQIVSNNTIKEMQKPAETEPVPVAQPPATANVVKEKKRVAKNSNKKKNN